MIALHEISEAPWHRYSWHGQLVSVDGCDASDFTLDDVTRLVAHYTSDVSDWDGDCAGIVQLKDGRFVSWESNWGPTGSGFCEDAYGGGADIYFAHTKEAAARHISEQLRERLEWAEGEAS